MTSGKIKPLKAVYSYYFPETRKIIDEIVKKYPHETFLQSVNPGLDDFHKPVIDQYQITFKDQLPNLKDFEFKYFTAGASEGIFHTLAQIAAFKPEIPLYTLKGEYEGYKGYGGNLGLKFTEFDESTDFSATKPGIFFLSNPSARDGNIIGDEFIRQIGDAGHEIIYDVTYVGMTKPHHFDLSHPAIKKVIVSLSKPYGLYYYRSGFMFSKDEMPTLEVNKWFKNILTLMISEAILKKYQASELAVMYMSQQQKATDRLNTDYGINAKPSDVYLLAHTFEKDIPEELKIYRRDKAARFCLTPHLLIDERGFV